MMDFAMIATLAASFILVGLLIQWCFHQVESDE